MKVETGWSAMLIVRKAKEGQVQITMGAGDVYYAYFMYRKGDGRHPGGETSPTFDNMDAAYDWADEKAKQYLGGWK